MDDPVSAKARKGRGAVGNPAGRFEMRALLAIDDGWSCEAETARLPTIVMEEAPRTILTRNTSPDVPFDRSINPYRGCEHGCVYCFARPAHAYLGLSPGLDFETKLFAKVDAPRLLARELSKPGYQPRTVMLGADTDPYQPIERQRRITRGILEVLAEFRHPVAIATKSALVCRDRDILSELAGQNLVSVGISVTTLQPNLARKLEPRAAAPSRRLAAMAGLSEAGVPVSVMAAPMIPHVNDHELESILQAARESGASGAHYTLIRLPHELKGLFTDWLEAHMPDRAQRVLNQVRECRDGQLYVSNFGARMTGTGSYAQLLAKRFEVACRRLGLDSASGSQHPLNTSRFRVPSRPGTQLALFPDEANGG